jgi:tetratricopeptide (TPR) repeat protein
MNQFYLTFSFIVLVLFTSCTSDLEETKAQVDAEWMKYNRAMEINDYEVAKNSIYSMISLDSNNVVYYDTLAKLYYLSKDYESSYKCAKKALDNGISEQTTEIAYHTSKALKKFEDASKYGGILLTFHEDSIGLQYELAFNYIQLYNYDKGAELLNRIILNPKSLKQNYNEYSGTGVQEIPYRASAYNLLGFIENEQGNKQVAKNMFQSALNIKNDYKLASDNLSTINEDVKDQ